MKVRIQMVFETEDGMPDLIEEIALLERGALHPSELGLSLAEAKRYYQLKPGIAAAARIRA